MKNLTLIFFLFISCATTYSTKTFFSEESKNRFVRKLEQERIKYQVRTVDTDLYEVKYEKRFDK